MVKNIIFAIYIIIIGIAIGVIVVSMNRNEEGLIQFGNTVLTEASSNILEPKILKGDLILKKKKKKRFKRKRYYYIFYKKK